MARINIEDEFFVACISLAARIGCQDKAIGMALRFFKMAQDKFKSHDYISDKEFQDEGFSEALFPKFAVRTENGIQAVDADRFFSWLRSKAEAGRSGGKKSAENRKNKNGTAQPKSKTEEIPRSTPEAKPSTPNPLTLSLTNINNNNESLRDCLARIVTAIPVPQMDAWRALYDVEFLNRQGLRAIDWCKREIKDPGTLDEWIKFLSTWFESTWNWEKKHNTSETRKVDPIETRRAQDNLFFHFQHNLPPDMDITTVTKERAHFLGVGFHHLKELVTVWWRDFQTTKPKEVL